MMILVDTSVWIDHLARGNGTLVAALNEGQVASHPFVVGELACGKLGNRAEILGLLAALPQARMAEHEELLDLLDRQQLSGRGLGWVDVHLLGSAQLSSCTLWTADKALREAARRLGIAHDGSPSR